MSGVLGILVAGGGAPGVIDSNLEDAADTGVPASISFQNDGDYLVSGSPDEEWVVPSDTTIAAFYQIQVNVTSGSIDLGTVDSWLDLSTTRSYQKNSAGTAVLRVRIREKASTIVRTDQSVSLIVS